MLGDAPLRVVDLGAGTGIFSRVLAGLGHDVVAVEPDGDMRRKLEATSPGIQALDGSAEKIPMPDASVDAVTAAQAFHWFDREAACAEIARVLRPAGVLAAISNAEDESVDWVAEWWGAVRPRVFPRTRIRGERMTFGPRFTQPERAKFKHHVERDADHLLGYIRSRSHYVIASAEEQRRMDAVTREIAARLPARFEVPYEAVAARARKL
jgi:SAM-dependent methyltransferase